MSWPRLPNVTITIKEFEFGILADQVDSSFFSSTDILIYPYGAQFDLDLPFMPDCGGLVELLRVSYSYFFEVHFIASG
jgi:hypothetical protein